MNCKMTSTANLNENEIILFILGDEKKESIQAIAIKDHVSTEIYLKDNVKVKHLQNSIKNKRIITPRIHVTYKKQGTDYYSCTLFSTIG